MVSLCDKPRLIKRLLVSAVSTALALGAAAANASALGFVESFQDSADDTLLGPSCVAMAPNGAHVYVSAAKDNSITIFSRDPASGRLTRTGAIVQDAASINGLSSADEVIVSPDGKNVYALGDNAGAVATLTVFGRDEVSGDLTLLQSLNKDNSLASLSRYRVKMAFSVDGKHLYITSVNTQAIVAFARAEDGSLSFVQGLAASNIGQSLIDSIRTPWDIALSSDGKNAYVVASGGVFLKNSLTVFSRDASSGALTALEAHYSGANGVTMMSEPQAVEVSPDGKFVYALSGKDGTIVTFARADDGKLTFVESHHHMDPTGTQNILLGAKTLTASADGALVYVGAESTALLAVMRRNSADGKLKLIGHEANGLNNLALGAPQSLALSPDEKQLYVATTGVVEGVTVFDTTTDLSVVVQDNVDSAQVGSEVAYAIMVTNGGSSDATNVSVAGTLPAGASYVSASSEVEGAACSAVGSDFSCTVPRIASGDMVSFTLRLSMPATAGSVTLDVVASADQIDSDEGNNADAEQTAVAEAPTVPDPNAGNDTAPPMPDAGSDAPATDQPAVDAPAIDNSEGGGGAVGPWWLVALLGGLYGRLMRRRAH